jgi:VanZ family protein
MPAIGQILETVWPFGALSFVWLYSGGDGGRRSLVYGGAAVFLLVALLEWLQQYIPGRTADMTTALLALTGWCLPVVLMETNLERGDGEHRTSF